MAAQLKSALAYRTIKDMIIDGSINDSTSLTELSISEMLGISRTPVRSALIALQNDGLIRIMPNQGIRLRELTVKEAKDQYQLRILLEKYMIEMSLKVLNEQDFSELRTIVQAQKHCIETHGYKEYLALDDQFHLLCCKYCENAAIKELWNRSRNMLFRVRLSSIREPGRLQASYDEHCQIYTYLRAGEDSLAEKYLLDHIDKGVLKML